MEIYLQSFHLAPLCGRKPTLNIVYLEHFADDLFSMNIKRATGHNSEYLFFINNQKHLVRSITILLRSKKRNQCSIMALQFFRCTEIIFGLFA